MQDPRIEIDGFNCPAPLSLEIGDGYSLVVEFSDGVTVDFDFKPYIDEGKFFAPLKDKTLFATATLTRWAVIWNDDIDIAIEAVYEKGKLIGVRS